MPAKSCAVLMSMVLLLLPAAYPQEQTASIISVPARWPPATVRKDVGEVQLSFSAEDKRGRVLSDIAPGEITVFDNGQRVENAVLLRLQDAPLYVGVLPDGSASLARDVTLVKKAAVMLVGKLRPNFDSGFMAVFGARTQVTQEFTGDMEKLAQAASRVVPAGPTGLYDAVVSACEKLATAPGRRALVLITDGEDNYSLRFPHDAVAAAQRFGITLVVLNVGRNPGSAGGQVMERMSEATGGLAIAARDPRRMSNAWERALQALRSEYVLAYPAPRGGDPDGYHRVRLTSTRRPELRLRYREGYFVK